MSKRDRPDRDYTLMKQGAVTAIFLVALIFGQDLRNSLFKSPASPDYFSRIARLEAQNSEHARLSRQSEDQANLIGGLQKATAKMIVQVEILAGVVGAMQHREYARLEAGKR